MSGMRSKVRERCLKYADQSGILITELKSKEWKEGTTHLVTPKLGRSEKTLAGMASGAYILTPAWLRDSAKKGGMISEKGFFATSTTPLQVAHNAAELWLGKQAFQGITAFFHSSLAENAPSRETLRRIFRAGNGEVAEEVHAGVHFAVGIPEDEEFIKDCAAKNVTAVSDMFVLEWLALPEKDLACHCLSATHSEQLKLKIKSRF